MAGLGIGGMLAAINAATGTGFAIGVASRRAERLSYVQGKIRMTNRSV